TIARPALSTLSPSSTLFRSQDLVHLERRGDRLDQHGRADTAPRDAELFLRQQEHVVPQPRFEMALQFRQIEVRAATASQQLSCVDRKSTRLNSSHAKIPYAV